MATYAQYLAALEQSRGLPAGYLPKTRQIESSGGINLHSPTGPDGPFQFTTDTGKRFGLLTEADRMDPYKSAMAAADYAKENMQKLRPVLGRDPTGWELYIGHNQGGGGAAQLFSNPNRVAGTSTIPQNIAVNGGNPNAPGSAFLNRFQSIYDKAQPTNLGEPFNAPPVAGTQTVPQQQTPVPGMAPPQQPPPQGKGLLDLIMQDGPVTGEDVKGFMGRSDTKQALSGLAKLGQQEQQPSKPPPPLPPLPMMAMDPGALENRPDVSTLTALLQKRRRVL